MGNGGMVIVRAAGLLEKQKADSSCNQVLVLRNASSYPMIEMSRKFIRLKTRQNKQPKVINVSYKFTCLNIGLGHRLLGASMHRRIFLQSSSAIFVSGLLFPKFSFAQEHLSNDQKADFAKNWGVQDLAQRLQDRTKAVPFSPRDFSNTQMLELFDAAKTDEERDYAAVENWHSFILDLTSEDHATRANLAKEERDLYGEQLGPARSSWAMAILHIAMFEAMNAFLGKFESLKPPGYTSDLKTLILAEAGLGTPEMVVKEGTLIAAISFASRQILRTLYPKKKEYIQLRADKLFKQVKGPGVSAGKRVGEATANIVLKSRGWSDAYGFTDGSEFPEPPASDFASADPGKWRPDPVSKTATALGGHWAHVRPFTMATAEEFRAPPPPAYGSPEFIKAYKEVKTLGGWGINNDADEQNSRYPTATTRTGDVEIKKDPDGTFHYKANESFKAVFWGYDGTAFLCAPPRLYNMLATTYAREILRITGAYELCRFLAHVNIAMGDAGISAWEAKFHYLIPRPITYIRNVDADSTPEGSGDSRWTPLGAAVTNATGAGRNVTPPFPAYPSGHAVFGGAVFEMLRLSGTELQVADGKFSFTSDEYNGENYSPGATDPRPEVPVEFANIAEAEEENGMSRIWMGIHWGFDKVEGIKQGNAIAKHVFASTYKPIEM